MQTLQEPEVLQQPFCASGDKNTIPSAATGSQLASLAQGFPPVTQQPIEEGGIPPEREDFNGAFNLLSQQNFAIQNGWLPTFNSQVSEAIGGYAEGACLWYMPSSGTYAGQVLLLQSLVANNTYDFTANPNSYIGTYWKVVTSAGGAALPLFYHTFADHLLNNASYLRADTFSWQSGNVYISAYNHLVADIAGKPVLTETVAGYTIGYYLADDGHKIVGPNYESTIDLLYTATGVAWYYILDTTNQRFKLPRSQYNFVGLRDSVGNYVAESLPNITGNFYVADVVQDHNTLTGASKHSGAFYGFSADGGVDGRTYASGYGGRWNFDASRSSSAYQNSAPVQQRATQAYLYFYVGNTIQDQTAIDVGEITEELNDKADIDLGNLSNAGKIIAANIGMPSNVYENLTLGTTGTKYQAPADGYFYFSKGTSTACQSSMDVYDTDGTTLLYTARGGTDTAGTTGGCWCSIQKGRYMQLNWDQNGTLGMFRFVYAEGSKSLA